MEANNGPGNGEDHGNEPIPNPHIRLLPRPNNPKGYPPFDMCLVPNYTNSQIAYYYTNGAIPAADQA